MKITTAFDFLRKSKKLEIQSDIIDHDLRKNQVKNNTAYFCILPYIYRVSQKKVSLSVCYIFPLLKNLQN